MKGLPLGRRRTRSEEALAPRCFPSRETPRAGSELCVPWSEAEEVLEPVRSPHLGTQEQVWGPTRLYFRHIAGEPPGSISPSLKKPSHPFS